MRLAEAAVFESWESAERPYPWTRKNFEETLESNASRVFVFEREEEVIGFAVVQLVSDEAYLSNLMVLKSRRRGGEGFRLLQEIMIWSKANGATKIALDVDLANKPAIKLYEKAGFRVTGHRKHSYPNGEDAVLMEKKL